MIVMNCATGTLAPYQPTVDTPWDRQRVLHLYRRLGNGATPEQVTQALSLNPTALVDDLIDAAINAAPLAPPVFADYTADDYPSDINLFFEQMGEEIEVWAEAWARDMVENPLRGKLTLFWSNHFVTRYDAYECTSYMYQYYKVLEEYAMGNFKEFVDEIGKTSAMLVFLNGAESTKYAPNENYARELYELFTLGADIGYTQEDIVETSRALTGWVDIRKHCGPIAFAPAYFDIGEKEIFGQKGEWGYDDVIRILFEERAYKIAQHICGKIYRYFVSHEVDQEIVDQLALTFQSNQFDLVPVYRQLFKSEHFFDKAVMQVNVKSPYDLTLSLSNELGLEQTSELLLIHVYFSQILGQQMFDPTDVAGWPGNRSWIDSNTLTLRWQASQYHLFNVYENEPEKLRSFAKVLAGNSNDPDFVAQQIIEHFIPSGFHNMDLYDRATVVFKGDVPQNYYDQGLWNLDFDPVPAQVALLINYIVRLPEFQTS